MIRSIISKHAAACLFFVVGMDNLMAFTTIQSFTVPSQSRTLCDTNRVNVGRPSFAGSNIYVHSPSLFDEVSIEDIQDLPIYNIFESIRESIRVKPNLLLEAPPGAGKTSTVPLLISSLQSCTDANANVKKVIVVEPRRVATRSAATRMADLVQQSVGQSVGYAIRGESRQSPKTTILVVTDGVLLNMLREDPELNGYGAVILDEFHERGVGSDTALALLREVQMNYRSDLLLIVMSATLLGASEENDDGEESTGTKLLRVLGGESRCNVLRSEGRQYPITIQHSQRGAPLHGSLIRDTKLLVKTMADAIEEGLLKAPDKGDVLAFLPGAKEINRVVREMNDRGWQDVDVFPLYGALPKPEQDRAIYKRNSDQRRRVIVSSPIAEASLTIPGVTCVVDSGLQRQPRYDANTGLPHLITVACSKDSAVQRAGRAGRTCDGYCIRLFSETEFLKLSEHSAPEVQLTDLVPTTLLLTEWGCSSANEILEDLPFIDKPPKDSLMKAYQMLVDLGAVEEYKLANSRRKRYKVTSRGGQIVRMPTHPRFATSIVRASEMGDVLLAAAVTAAALVDQELVRGREANLALNVRDILNDGPQSFNGKQLLNFASRISEEAKYAVSSALSGKMSAVQVSDSVGTAILPGFVDLIAQRQGEASYGGSSYMLSLGRTARLDGKQDEGEYIIVVDTSTGDDGKTRIRSYSKIDPAVLQQVSSEVEEVFAVPSRGYQVRKRKVSKVGSLVLSSTPLPAPSPDEIVDVLLDVIDSLGGVPALLPMQSKKNVAAIKELQKRILSAQECSTNDAWPKCFTSFDAIQRGVGTVEDETILLNVIEPWLGAAASLKSLDLLSIFETQLSVEQQNEIDRYFPTLIEAPDGSNIPIIYTTETGPIASAKLQQFFGQQESPTVGPPGKSIPVSLSLLSPSGKPLAQTIDLPFFWKETYPSVRAEMRGRYPKHPWPEDPLTATATRMTKKQQTIKSLDGNEQGVDKRKERSKQRKKKR